MRWKRSLERYLTKLDSSGRGGKADDSRCESRGSECDCGAGQELLAILQEAAQRFPGCALIAYGSRITGEADDHSDLDIFVIECDPDAGLIRETTKLGGIEIDVARVGYNVLVKGMRARSKHNNNWFLNALRKCCIHGDHDGEARRLQSIAKSIWEGGPPALAPKHLEVGRVGLLRLQDSVEKLSARAGASPQAARLARMSCDQLVALSIYLFYSVRRRWTTSFQRLLGRCRIDYPELYALWLDYVYSVEPEEAFGVAKRIVGAVHEGVFAATASTDCDERLASGVPS